MRVDGVADVPIARMVALRFESSVWIVVIVSVWSVVTLGSVAVICWLLYEGSLSRLRTIARLVCSKNGERVW